MWELLQSFLLLKNIVPTNPNKGTSQKVSLKINFSKIQNVGTLTEFLLLKIPYYVPKKTKIQKTQS
ncbi:hypothetical protein LEP1GSC132_1589 [Leptospira kirschneri str. 200803703]|nr:hypothetical protein LEP1GSC018_3228 [Leptospira kirschneri str. 2008720114]EMO69491.1 hypothetical protein LEP1GSC132_1589 [Leptospira kirschneri str. 200803703]EMO82442.1 hypothetical protein LEP1GSC126_2311 [Leptospira kirschneri str. 200801774]